MSPSSSVQFRLIFLLSTVFFVALSGCAALDGQERQLPGSEEVEETLANLNAVNATVVSSLNDTRISERQTMFEVGTQRRRSTTQVGETESLVVANDSMTWRYDRAANTVQRTRRVVGEQQSNVTISRSMESIFGRLNAASDDSDRETALDPLILPSAGGGGPQPFTGQVESFENASLNYHGTETVAGREAYVVEAVPQADVNTANITLWIDQEWYYPLQWNSTIVVDEERRTVTTAYRNVTFNPEIRADTFTNLRDKRPFTVLHPLRHHRTVETENHTVEVVAVLLNAIKNLSRIEIVGISGDDPARCCRCRDRVA